MGLPQTPSHIRITLLNIHRDRKERDDDMAAAIKDLKEMITELKMDLVKANVQNGACPYAVYTNMKTPENCEDIDCTTCTRKFYEEARKIIRERLGW